MSFDIDRALRAIKPEKRFGPLSRRLDRDLRWADDEPEFGGALLLDTTVYVDVLQGRVPGAVDSLLRSRLHLHSSVCLAELTHLFGRLDPRHVATPLALARVRTAIAGIPARRLHEPDIAAWGQAGILAGLLGRLDGETGPDAAGAARRQNDALIGLQARGLGASLLTRNLRDFDLLEQLVPDLRPVFYRIEQA